MQTGWTSWTSKHLTDYKLPSNLLQKTLRSITIYVSRRKSMNWIVMDFGASTEIDYKFVNVIRAAFRPWLFMQQPATRASEEGPEKTCHSQMTSIPVEVGCTLFVVAVIIHNLFFWRSNDIVRVRVHLSIYSIVHFFIRRIACEPFNFQLSFFWDWERC